MNAHIHRDNIFRGVQRRYVMLYKQRLNCYILVPVPVCVPETPKVVSGDRYDARFPVQNLFTKDAKELPDNEGAADMYTAKTNYWLAPKGAPASFVLNLGCVQTFQGVKLVNTHNRWYKNRGTQHFR